MVRVLSLLLAIVFVGPQTDHLWKSYKDIHKHMAEWSDINGIVRIEVMLLELIQKTSSSGSGAHNHCYLCRRFYQLDYQLMSSSRTRNSQFITSIYNHLF